MIKFFLLLALIFGGVYYSLTRESLPAIVEQKVNPGTKVKTVVEMANYLSAIAKKDVSVVVHPEINLEKNSDLEVTTATTQDERLPLDSGSTLPLEYSLPDDLAARLPSSEGESEEETDHDH